MKKNPIDKLCFLLIFHPEASVIPVVDEEVVTGEYSTYIGEISNCFVKKVYRGKEQLFYYDENEAEEVLSDYLGDEESAKLTVEETFAAYEKVPWKTAIILQIVPPNYY